MKLNFFLGLLFFLQTLCFCQTGEKYNVLDFGAKSNTDFNNSIPFQECLDKASAKQCTCYVPAGVYQFDSDLFLSSNTIFKGEEGKTILNFNKGGIRGKKNNSINFYYPRNYGKEIVPNNITTKALGYKAESKGINVEKANLFKKGDEIVIFNNKKDTWTILEDKSQKNLWNTSNRDLIARGGSFKIVDIINNTLIINSEIDFDLNNSSISKRSGIQNSTIKGFIINAFNTLYAINIEQPFNLSIIDNTINGKGGVVLSNYANKSKILNNIISSGPYFAINIENFSSENIIDSNDVTFKRSSSTGGDSAIIIVLSSYNNIIENNNVHNTGNLQQNFGGIFIHSFSYKNIVNNNKIDATSGLGIYFGSYDNIIKNNVVSNSRIGFISHYSQNNKIMNNNLGINFKTKLNRYGYFSEGSEYIDFKNNKISGEMEFGINIQSAILNKDKIGNISNNKIFNTKKGHSVDFNIKGLEIKKTTILIKELREENESTK